MTLAEAQRMLIPGILWIFALFGICYIEHLRRRERAERLEAQRKLLTVCEHVLLLRVSEEHRAHLRKVMRYWTPETIVEAVMDDKGLLGVTGDKQL